MCVCMYMYIICGTRTDMFCIGLYNLYIYIYMYIYICVCV